MKERVTSVLLAGMMVLAVVGGIGLSKWTETREAQAVQEQIATTSTILAQNMQNLAEQAQAKSRVILVARELAKRGTKVLESATAEFIAVRETDDTTTVVQTRKQISGSAKSLSRTTGEFQDSDPYNEASSADVKDFKKSSAYGVNNGSGVGYNDVDGDDNPQADPEIKNDGIDRATSQGDSKSAEAEQTKEAAERERGSGGSGEQNTNEPSRNCRECSAEHGVFRADRLYIRGLKIYEVNTVVGEVKDGKYYCNHGNLLDIQW